MCRAASRPIVVSGLKSVWVNEHPRIVRRVDVDEVKLGLLLLQFKIARKFHREGSPQNRLILDDRAADVSPSIIVAISRGVLKELDDESENRVRKCEENNFAKSRKLLI